MTNATDHSADRPTIYPSAIDLWIAAALFSSPVFAGGLGIYLWWDGNHHGAVVLLLTALFTLLVTLILILPCRYTIEVEDLHIRCGVISYRVPLKVIDRIEPSRTLISGPALSMKRVLVGTKLKNHILSPRDRERFIEDLREAVARARSNHSDA